MSLQSIFKNLNEFESKLPVVTSLTFYPAVETDVLPGTQNCVQKIPHTGIYNFLKIHQ